MDLDNKKTNNKDQATLYLYELFSTNRRRTPQIRNKNLNYQVPFKIII